MQVKNRKMKLNKKFAPISETAEEVYGGFLQFNISAIIKDIASKKLIVDKKRIHIKNWFKEHSIELSTINKEHLPSVDLSIPIIQAEMRINKYEIIDGNHRMQKAFDNGRMYINSYKLSGEQLANYLMSKEQYESYVLYWNGKLDDYIQEERYKLL
jgi:hypothetical protein